MTGKQKQPAATSPAIPAVVGVVLVIVVLGILLSLDSWRSSPAASAANPTALPMPTHPIPYPEVPRISVKQAQEQLARGEILMVDVRSKASYDRLHIEGAVSIPEDQIESRLDELDRERSIVLYCT
jgi:3-mercaptopyruvate sulfurtransferase SseA